MTYRDEDNEIIDSALDTLAWQRREIERLTAERDNAAKAERDRIVAWLLNDDNPYPDAYDIADEIERGEHLK